MRTSFVPFAISMAAITVIANVACGGSSVASEPSTTPTEAATSFATTTTTAAPQLVAEPTATVEAPPAAPQPQPSATAPAKDLPLAQPPAVVKPKVLWMLSDHAGPGVVTIRWATNVPTTGEVRVMTNQSGAAFFFSDASEGLATEHAVSVPANFGRYSVVVADGHGNSAEGSLRVKADPQGIEWGTGALAPVVKPDGSKHLLVQWGFVNGHSGNGFAASALVFTKDADCTTADACEGEPIGPAIAAQKEHNGNADHYAVYTSIGGAAFDYQVVVTQPRAAGDEQIAFLQLEIRGDQLPKTVVTGPGTIKN